ncbi:hypothetical protein COPG_00114 [Colwellia phage 9A]|uniref:Uncharacterized protein n=1 Tax=Colwellia phage 9A TaxID=765765 RepID=I3UMJ5_9CAUD|nr:hypothetical protein COPG_00114 [Colwellia phage 9A]AFK66710.1 hypothetical protein COPG_00114 [Colwellia phage 9A]
MPNKTSKSGIKKSFAFMKKHGRMDAMERTRMTEGLIAFYVTHDGYCPMGVRHHIIDGEFDFCVIRNAFCVSLKFYNELTKSDI